MIGANTYSLSSFLTDADETYQDCEFPVICGLLKFISTTLNDEKGIRFSN